MDFDKLKQQIKAITKQAFLENFKKYGQETHSFALVSDDGAMTIVPFTNTVTHLQKMQTEDLEYKEVYEFEPAEWFTSDGANEEVNKICQTLASTTQQLEGSEFEQFKYQLFETCVEVLEELQTEKFFTNQLQKEIMVLFSISDTEETTENLTKWNKRINCLEIGKSYENYQNIEY